MGVKFGLCHCGRRVFENRVLKRIFGPKRDEVTKGWRKLHNEVLRNLYCSPSIIRVIKSRRMRWAEHVARMGRRTMGYWWESQKERDRWEDQDVGGLDNIRMDLGEIGWGGVDWIRLAQDRVRWTAVVNVVVNILHKMLGNYRVDTQLVASRVVHSSTE
jgi:hypothetical protein